MEERELIEQTLRGNTDAFSFLVKKYENKVFHLASGFVPDRATADDLAQEVFLKAYLALPKFQFRSEFGTWLYRIAVNHMKDYLRKRARREEVALDPAKEALLAAEDARQKEEEERTGKAHRDLVMQMLRKLPLKHQMILTLRDIDGLSYEEIGQILRLSPGTVDSRLFRARRKLRDKMMPYLG
jgi:RNA polymerase sigma-70 factor (ECF subfamily)